MKKIPFSVVAAFALSEPTDAPPTASTVEV
jgi:hypothetical protein